MVKQLKQNYLTLTLEVYLTLLMTGRKDCHAIISGQLHIFEIKQYYFNVRVTGISFKVFSYERS